jgi:hypothetical protein
VSNIPVCACFIQWVKYKIYICFWCWEHIGLQLRIQLRLNIICQGFFFCADFKVSPSYLLVLILTLVWWWSCYLNNRILYHAVSFLDFHLLVNLKQRRCDRGRRINRPTLQIYDRHFVDFAVWDSLECIFSPISWNISSCFHLFTSPLFANSIHMMNFAFWVS